MRFDKLEREDQWYEIDLGDHRYSINGVGVDSILSSNQVFIQLPNSEVVNRNFIRSINKDHDKTRDNLKVQPKLIDKYENSMAGV